MIFSTPEWNSEKQLYKVHIFEPVRFKYTETRLKSSGESFFSEINTSNESFLKVLNEFADALYTEGNSWFASPITQKFFLKRVHNTFEAISTGRNYGNSVEFSWVPTALQINPKTFELKWDIFRVHSTNSVIPSDFIDITEELEPKTIVIQNNDLIENVEIPFDDSEQPTKIISSRAVLKQKIRKAKLKAAVAAMKAERLAEKYFRRYGIQTDFDSESDLSYDSSEEESDEE